MKKVFISGCYDILHGGHIQFFREARALGDQLTVCFASDKVLWEHKKRRSSIPQDHKLALMAALDMVDQVVIEAAGLLAKDAVRDASISKLGEAVSLTYQMQLKEGM